MRTFRIPLRTLRLKKREFNRKDAEKCKVRKVQFHAVYSIFRRECEEKENNHNKHDTSVKLENSPFALSGDVADHDVLPD